jgi:predicted metal-dependent hydrolase
MLNHQFSLFDAPLLEPALDQAAWGVPVRPSTSGPQAPFIHPLADARIELKGRMVGYLLRRTQRRSIGFLVGTDGLRVSAPRSTSRREIEAALHEKADWIVRKLQDQGERSRQLQAVQLDWHLGATLPFLGSPLQVQRASVTDFQPEAQPATLRLRLPPLASPLEVQRAVMTWLKRQALPLFTERCDRYAPLLNVRHTKLCLSSAQTRWGSAHTTGTLRLNWRLIHFPLSVIDYVVAHELAHLREMNHSSRFWNLVESVVPDVSAAQRILKDTVLPAWR